MTKIETMKNRYKKRDAQGNKLSEHIGKGLDYEHYLKVLEARKEPMVTKTFRCPEKLRKDWEKIGGTDALLRQFMINLIAKKTR